MPLRQHIKTHPETVADMLLAADDRYREAEELLLAQEFDGGVYLLGYCAEMWLKVACLLLRNVGLNAPVMPALSALKKWVATTATPAPAFTDWHDLRFLAEAARLLRSSQGRPLHGPLLAGLGTYVVGGLHAEWVVDMRYRRSAVPTADAWSALTSAWWVKTSWRQLV